jgi:hypothetical protein
MNVLRPTLSCRATEHIQSQLDLVLNLEKKVLLMSLLMMESILIPLSSRPTEN